MGSLFLELSSTGGWKRTRSLLLLEAIGQVDSIGSPVNGKSVKLNVLFTGYHL